MFTLTVTVATKDELLGIAQLLSGVSASVESAPAPKAAKEPTNTEKGKAATVAAAPKKQAKREVSLDELQTKIGEFAGGDTAKIKEFVAKHGAKKTSLLDAAQRIAAFDDVEAFFGEEADDENEEDPMA